MKIDTSTHTTQGESAARLTPEVRSLLRSVSILESLEEDEIDCLADVEQIHLNEGDVLLRQGEPAKYYYILLKGKVSLFQIQPNKSELVLLSYTSGTGFGELPLLAGMPSGGTARAMEPSHLMRFDEESFWELMTSCPQVRKAILGNMALRFQKYQNLTLHQEKMASLGTLAAGLMHELNNPGAAAKRAASQLRENLERMHQLSLKLSQTVLSKEQKDCLFELQDHAMAVKTPIRMNSLEQSDAEEKLATWMEEANLENAWKLAPTLVSIGMSAEELDCARRQFQPEIFSDCLGWLEALVSSMQLVGMVEESIGRVSELVHAVKMYAYEGKGAKQTINVNDSIHATLVILGHKMRAKEITVEREFAEDLPLLQTEKSGLNQVWTNLLDNAIDAAPAKGVIHIKTWSEQKGASPTIFISLADNGSGIPIDVQPHIFDAFYTTKDVGVGTGLGLGIVSRIVEQYGGTIRFSSEPGATEFVVALPSSKAQ